MKNQYSVRLHTLLFVLGLFVNFFNDATAQESPKSEYMIDASERLRSNKSNPNESLQQTFFNNNQGTAIVVNKHLYSNAQLTMILPAISKNQKSVHSINVITDRNVIRRYTEDEVVTSLILFKVRPKLAWQIKRANTDLGKN